MPIKINGTDIDGNKLEFRMCTFTPFLMEGDPILIDQTQTNLKSLKFSSNHITPQKTTLNHITPHKTTSNHITPHKTTSNRMRPHNSKVVVLTDVPPGSPTNITQIHDVVNTVGPVPMTSGYGPDTFPHSAAHVLNTNNNPSSSEGEQINKIYASVAPPIVKYLTFNMSHPTSGGGKNHKYSEHTQSTSGVKINNSKPKIKDTEYVLIISGVSKCTDSSFSNALKKPLFTSECPEHCSEGRRA